MTAGRTFVPQRPRRRRPEGKDLVAAPDGDFWVFGYGSLMWRPGFPFLAQRRARLWGYHRTLCIYSVEYRGTYERPGLVFGLDRGGCCIGMAFKVAAADGPNVMGYLYEREMVTGVYRPRWLACDLMAETETAGGKDDRVIAYTFVADTDHDQYTGKMDDETAVATILQGTGKAGPCQTYLENTLEHLRELGIPDPALDRIVKKTRSAKARQAGHQT